MTPSIPLVVQRDYSVNPVEPYLVLVLTHVPCLAVSSLILAVSDPAWLCFASTDYLALFIPGWPCLAQFSSVWLFLDHFIPLFDLVYVSLFVPLV